MKTYIGIDNGVTGSIFILRPAGANEFFKTPVKKEQSYTKAKQNISRIAFSYLTDILCNCNLTTDDCLAIIERPMVNPQRFKASASALRCLEATLIALEEFDISYQYIDSKEWQKIMLPKSLKGVGLKKASVDISCRLFPKLKKEIIKHGDGDSLLIAEYARRKGL